RRPEVPALERSGAEVLDEDVALLRKLEQELLPALRAEVERAALLVPRLDRPPQRAAVVPRPTPLPHRVRLPRRLDLDDLCAHVAEQPAGERPGEEHPELDHPNARQRARPVGARAGGLGRERGPAHSAFVSAVSASSARRRATSRSRASNTCSFMISSARSESRAVSAVTIWRW